MKATKKIGIILFAMALIAVMSINVIAADPIVIDFSKNDFIMGNIGGQGEMNVVNDGDRRVLFAECTDGYDPADDPEGTSTKGDLYASVEDFASYGVDGTKHKYMKASIKNGSAAPYLEIHFAAPTQGFHVSTSVSFEIKPNSDYTTYVWNVEEWSEKYYPKRPLDDPWPNHWAQGAISGLRIDFMYYEESGGHAKTGDKMWIEYIAFFETKEAADAWTFTPARTVQSILEAKAAADAEKEAAAAAKAEEAAANAPAAADDNAGDAANDAGEAAEGDEAATNAPASANNSDDDNNMIMWILIAIGAIVIIIIIVVIVTKPKKKAE